MDTTNRNTALASALVEELARCGVRRAAISPGSRSTPLAVALWRHPAIEATVILDERSAGFFALGAGMADRVPAVVLCTSGTAAANLHPAVCEADESGVALLVLTADRPPELRHVGAGQTIDQLKLYGSAVRWFCDVGTNEADDAGLLHLRSTACRGFAAARGEPRPGPVHLNLAWRDPLDPAPQPGEVTASSPLALEGRGERPLTNVSPLRGALDSRLLDELASRLGAAARPLIVAGRQPDPRLAPAVTALARAAGAPILAEPTSQLRCGPHDRGLVVSAYDAICRLQADQLAPDLMIRFGELPTSKPLRGWLSRLQQADQLVVDPSGGWNEPTRHAARIVRADPVVLAGELAARVEREADDWAHRWLEADRLARQAFDTELAALGELTEPGIQLVLSEGVGDEQIIHAASSMPIRDQEAFFPASPQRLRFLANRGANGIDGLVSSAAGIAASSHQPTWGVLGDLALLHDSNGLATLRHAPGLRLLVIDNRGGGIFSFLPQAESMRPDDYEALLATPSGIDIAALGSVHELLCEDVGTAAELAAALAGEARIVIAHVPSHEANREIHDRLNDAAVSVVSAALAASAAGDLGDLHE